MWYLERIRVQTSGSDGTFFYCSKRKVFLLNYIDDIVMANPEFGVVRYVVNQIAHKVDLETGRYVDCFLGIAIMPRGNCTTISISLLVDSIIHKFNMAEPKSTATPIAAGARIEKDKEIKPTDVPNEELVQTLLYLVNTVKADITYTVGRLSRFYADPGKYI